MDDVCILLLYLLWMTFGAFCYNNDRYDRDSRSTHAPKSQATIDISYFLADFTCHHVTHLPSFLPRQTLIGCGDDRCLEKGEGRQHHHLDPGRAWLHHGSNHAEIYIFVERNTYTIICTCMHVHMLKCMHIHIILYTYILYTLYIFNGYCSQCIGIRIFK